MFYKHSDTQPIEMLPGLTRRVLATSERMMLVEFSLEQGAEVPQHNHPHDQVGFVAIGRVKMVIGDQTAECGVGDSYHAPPGVAHSALALEPSVLMDAFSPPREDYRQA